MLAIFIEDSTQINFSRLVTVSGWKLQQAAGSWHTI